MAPKIDESGRLVVPAAIRRKLGLLPGSEVELVVDNAGLRVRQRPAPPVVRRIGGRLIAVPTAPPANRAKIDPAQWVEKERWNRN